MVVESTEKFISELLQKIYIDVNYLLQNLFIFSE
jgi:hypothetical protein